MGNTEVRMSEDPRQLEGTPAEPGRPEGHNARQRLGLLALSVLSALVFAGALAYAIGGGLLSVGGEDIGQRERRDLPREWTNLIPLRPVGPELVAGLGRGRDASEVAGSSDQSERGQRGRDERGQRGRDAGRDGSPTTARLGPIPGALATRLPRPRVVTVIGPLALPRLPGVVELVPSLPQLPEITPGVDPIPGKGVDIPPGGLFPGGLPRPPTGLPIPGAGGVTPPVSSVARGAVEAPQLLGMDAALRELDARARQSGSESPAAGDGKAKARRSGRDSRRRSEEPSRLRREVTRVKDVALDRPDPASRGSGHRDPEAPPKQEEDSPQPAPADRRRSSHTPDSEACRATGDPLDPGRRCPAKRRDAAKASGQPPERERRTARAPSQGARTDTEDER